MSRGFVGRWLTAVSAGFGLAACQNQPGFPDLERLERSIGARTVVHEPGFVLYSPFSIVGTLQYRNVLSAEVERVAALFEVPPEERIFVWLSPVSGMRPRIELTEGKFQVTPAGAHPRHGIDGFAGRSIAVVYVEPPGSIRSEDGRTIEGNWAAESYVGVLRHELAHVYAALSGLRGEPWFNEGIAHVVEFAPVEGAVTRWDKQGPLLHHVVSIPPERRELTRAFSLRETLEGIEAGREKLDIEERQLAASFVSFLLNRRSDPTFHARARAILDTPTSALLALEGEWRTWIASGPAHVPMETAATSREH